MSVFTSRWKALWWSAGVLMTAYCSVPSADESAQSDADQGQATKQAVDALGALNSPQTAPNQD